MIVRHSEEIVRFVCQCDKCGHSGPRANIGSGSMGSRC